MKNSIFISAIEISMLMQAINFSSLMDLKIFNAVNTGVGLGLATLLLTADLSLYS